MAEEKKKSNTLLIIVIVIVGLLGLGGIVGAWVFKKVASKVVSKVVESKTGVSVDGDESKFTFTDQKTGQKVVIGADQKLPDGFPADFPVYPGSKPTGSMSGVNLNDQKSGLWVVLTTTDSLATVSKYYKDNLDKSGWVIQNTMTLNGADTYAVKKAEVSGMVALSNDDTEKGTSIMITLGTSN